MYRTKKKKLKNKTKSNLKKNIKIRNRSNKTIRKIRNKTIKNRKHGGDVSQTMQMQKMKPIQTMQMQKMKPIQSMQMQKMKPIQKRNKLTTSTQNLMPSKEDMELLKTIYIDPEKYKGEYVNLDIEPSDSNNWGILKFPIIPNDKIPKWSSNTNTNFTNSTNSNIIGGAKGTQPFPTESEKQVFASELKNCFELKEQFCIFMYSTNAENRVISTEWFFLNQYQVDIITTSTVKLIYYPTIFLDIDGRQVPYNITNNEKITRGSENKYLSIKDDPNNLISIHKDTIVFPLGSILICQRKLLNQVFNDDINATIFTQKELLSIKRYTRYWDGYIICFQQCNNNIDEFMRKQQSPVDGFGGEFFTKEHLDLVATAENYTLMTYYDTPFEDTVEAKTRWLLMELPLIVQNIQNAFYKTRISVDNEVLFFNPNTRSLLPYKYVYRGMTRPYLSKETNQPLDVGDSIILQTFISTSIKREKAETFSISSNLNERNRYLYKFTLQFLPYLSLEHDSFTEFLDEQEVLLPPNVILTVTSISSTTNTHDILHEICATIRYNDMDKLITKRQTDLYKIKDVYNSFTFNNTRGIEYHDKIHSEIQTFFTDII
jgi:hypothetical protein